MDLTVVIRFVAGVVLLIWGAELLVRGASRLAVAAGISPLVVGLTVVAFGTSAPELAVTVGSSFTGEADLALGNVVGSNILNILLILGLSALVAPLTVAQQLVRLDVPLVIGASVLVFLLGLDGGIRPLEGVLLFSLLVAYLVYLIRRNRREMADLAALQATEDIPRPEEAGPWQRNVAFVLAGLMMLALGARWLVESAVATASALGLSELVIGLTVVAAGTSLPEVATSVLASLRGERDIAVGNVVGSNLFNLLAVLGLGSLVSPGGIPVPPGALSFDIPVMIAVAIAALPVFFTGYTIQRWEGGVFLLYYIAYTTFLVLRATEHHALSEFRAAMIWFVIPLTVITFAVLGLQSLRQNGNGATVTSP
jgi:cation:H+ antiporter